MSTDATALPPAIRANLEAVLPMLRDLYREDRPALREQRAAALIDWAAGLCAALAVAVQERDSCRQALAAGAGGGGGRREERVMANDAAGRKVRDCRYDGHHFQFLRSEKIQVGFRKMATRDTFYCVHCLRYQAEQHDVEDHEYRSW